MVGRVMEAHEVDLERRKSYIFASFNDKEIKVVLAENEKGAWDKLGIELLDEKPASPSMDLWRLIQICIY